ncbi:aldehyde ferredoxin oxidoreductase C-terminal domain-containing protein [Pseudodesulfovibrio piezophilus]|uniref:Aldehyde ferredoxin oxidoreductase n=1 Tax=Pseudodesulfovibrio piezophilus (strain DSM 21447 / JCM 15486 / C1TLV30) TaxID=1322246 RepID=M1WK73_PSEP2|nr:aldehyde ferredoxin oxidoreductase C-terminal domain-containing protein [Pseudodesulfovibrio piezophilus]CCH49101.1 Aldehyde ferredoxin oxidoreductase [Pseudodesulfovibrio piezophilus C1TLV30]
MDTIIRINVGASGGPKADKEPIGKYVGFGGRAMTAAMVHDEVPPQCHPLGPENKLIIAPGLLTGSAASTSGRLSVGCKSPLTGGIKESNVGGMAGQYLGHLGIAAIVLEGNPSSETLYKVIITREGVSIEPDDDLRMLTNYELCARLKKIHGSTVAVISIGPAGEMGLSNSSVAVTDAHFRPTRQARRGGVGAVMGAKHIKCIVIDPAGTTIREPADPERFETANRKFIDGLHRHHITGHDLPQHGTNVLTNLIDGAGSYPALNFRHGRFDGTPSIDGYAMELLADARSESTTCSDSCFKGCSIQCSAQYLDKDGNFLSKRPSYQTIWAHGANCGIDDLDVIARLDFMDDDFGFDSIEMGVAIGLAMDAGVIEFGDAEGAIRLLKEAGRGTPMGRILGSGAATVARCFGLERAPVVKGQAMPAYDPRSVKGIGVTYATSPQGADHTAGYAVAPNILKVGRDIDPLGIEGQIDISRNLQIATAALDATGYCLFVSFAILDQPDTFDAMLATINGMFDLKLTGRDIVELGKLVLRMERAFNEKAGFTKFHDRLPMYFSREPLGPHNTTFDIPDKDLDLVHQY